MDMNRRNFVRGAAVGAAGTALTGGLLVGGARADANAAQSATLSDEPSYPFFGAHQAGILRPDPAHKQRSSCFAAFDVTATNRAGLTALKTTRSQRGDLLNRGGAVAEPGLGAPPVDSACRGWNSGGYT